MSTPKRTRPVRHPEPIAGEVYRWSGGNGKQKFMIIDVYQDDREIWLCRAVDLQKEIVTEIGMRKRDEYNGWTKVETTSLETTPKLSAALTKQEALLAEAHDNIKVLKGMISP